MRLFYYMIQLNVSCVRRSELLIIQLLVPQASFLGHLAGILAGFIVLWQSWACCNWGGFNRRAAGTSTTTTREWSFFFHVVPVVTLTACAAVASLHLGVLRKPWATSHFWRSGASLVCLSWKQVGGTRRRAGAAVQYVHTYY